MMEQDDDDIDLSFAALSRKIKRSLNQNQKDDLIDEIQMLVSRHIQNVRENPNNAPTPSTSNAVPMHQGIDPGMNVNNMPALQRMPSYSYDPLTDQHFTNM